MFRLVRIEGSRSNAPEFEKFPRDNSYLNPKAGAAVALIDGTLGAAEYYPQFIITRDYKLSTNEDIACYRVTPDMVFKVEYLGDEPPTVGLSVALDTMNTLPDAVTYDEEGPGRIVALCDTPNFVYVKFDLRRDYE